MGASTTTTGSHARRHSQALIILDLLSEFRFPGAEELIKPALRAASQISRLRSRARRHCLPCIFINDNCGHWNTDCKELIRRCHAAGGDAARIATLLEPAPEDFLILKPRHSGFFATPLHTLLNQLSARTLILTGVTAHQCVLFTAIDAYMRDFDLIVPSDCVAADSIANKRHALALLEESLNARVVLQASIRLQNVPRRKQRTAAS